MIRDLEKQILEEIYNSMESEARKMGLKFSKDGSDWKVSGDEEKVKKFIEKYKN